MQLLSPLVLFILALGPTKQESSLHGTVVTPEGKPAEGVQVGPSWTFEEEPHPFDGTTTDRRGRYRVTVETYGKQAALLALDVRAGLGALACLDGGGGKLDLELGPARRVFGRIGSTELGRAPEWTNVYVYARCGDDRARIAQCTSEAAEFSFLLPAGEYMLNVYGRDVADRNERVLVGAQDIDLGTVDLPATKLAKLYGQSAPELTITEARGVEPGLRLSDLRGRYVLIEFWGHW